jgi:hypothetical protein
MGCVPGWGNFFNRKGRKEREDKRKEESRRRNLGILVDGAIASVIL